MATMVLVGLLFSLEQALADQYDDGLKLLSEQRHQEAADLLRPFIASRRRSPTAHTARLRPAACLPPPANSPQFTDTYHVTSRLPPPHASTP